LARCADPIAEGRPELELRDEEREAIAELVADALIAAVEREREAEAAR
jgi:hypothetical protein